MSQHITVNTHCNLLYALNVWNYFNIISKRWLNFWVKLLFIKHRCLIMLIEIVVSLEMDEGQQNV